MHITFLENKPNVAGKGPNWLFDLDYLTDSMNYHPVSSENQANHAGQQEANQNAGTEDIIDVGDSDKEDDSAQDCFVLPIWPSYSSTNTPALTTDDKREGPREEEQVFMDDLERLKKQEKEAYEEAEALRKKFETLVIKEGAAKPSSTNIFSTVSTPAKASSTNLVNTVSLPVSTASPHEGLSLADPTYSEEDDSEIPPLEDIYQSSTDGIFTTSSFDDEGAVADFTNLETVVNVSPIPTSRIHSTHPKALILGDPNSAVQCLFFLQTRKQTQYKLLGAHALSYQMDVKVRSLYGKLMKSNCVIQPPGFQDPKYPQKVYKVVKALYGLHQAPRAWYATLSTFLLKNGYRRGTIDKTLFLKKDKNDIILVQVYVDDIIFGSTKKSWCDEFEALMKSRFQMSSMGELTFFLGLQVKQKPDGIFISQDKYVAEILKKFDFANVKTASTPIETQKPLVKDEEANDVDVHLYSSLKDFPSNVSREFLEQEYVAAASCCGQVLWIQNQMLDYGFNFMNTKIYIDNESTICIVKNPVYHSKTKHIAIRHHFIRDAYEKKLIQVLKIHTDDNVADLLTKAFDVSSTASAKLVPLGQVCTALEMLKKNTDEGTKCKLKRFFLKLALISLFTTIFISRKMAVLDSCPKHNMVAYLEKSEGNVEFHEIIDFLTRSSIHHALTVSPIVSTTFVEQFWTSAKTQNKQKC
ncbi:putative ribonuclease H-like domain-containing protein [Tanacetum coccineum]